MEPARSPWHPKLMGIGLSLIAAYVAIDQVHAGLEVRFRAPFTYVGAGEHMFWLAHLGLLLPGIAALAWGAGPLTAGLAARVGRLVTELPRSKALLALGVTALAAVVAYRLGHLAFLADLPFTDDEHAARFGGQVLATGHVFATLPLLDVLPTDYLFVNPAGAVTSMDWLGLVSTWAVAELTGAGAWVFALWAAVPVFALPLAAGKAWGRGAAAVALAIALVSPMAFALSLTTHVHVVSRGALAIAVCAYVFGREGGRRLPWLVAGAALGFGLLTRPIETAALVAPLGLWELWQAVRGDVTARRALVFMAPGLLAAGAAFVAYNLATTGSWSVPPRAASDLLDVIREPDGVARYWARFGMNLSFNALLLGVYFLGPLGVAAVVAGARDPLSRRLLWGVGLALLLALMHANTGVHAVGPIHYADAFVPLALVAARGATRLLAWQGPQRLQVFGTVGLVAVLGYAAFDVHQADGLRAQADVHANIYAPFDDPTFPRSVVLAQQYAQFWDADPQVRALGTWVFNWRRPHPAGTDRVVFVHDLPGRQADIMAAYPDRAVWRLARVEAPPYMQLSRLR